MRDVTQILEAIESGDPEASDELLPLVYDELRRLAGGLMAGERPGQTLQPTALVHEAYVRLVDADAAEKCHSRRHFFAAAAEAMRRILVERARRKARLKHGGGLIRQPLDEAQIAAPPDDDQLIALDEALEGLAQIDPQAAELVKLRYFSGLTIPQAAELLGVSSRTADRLWAYARAWLYEAIRSRG